MKKKAKKLIEKNPELQTIIDDIVESAQDVVQDYTENPSDMSGSFHYVHGSSPILHHQELKDRIHKREKHDD